MAFGTTSRLLYRKTIRSDADIEKLLKFCDDLSCDDEYTYIPSGLNAGVGELFRFYEKYPSGISDLVLMSDGLNNPPRELGEDEMLTYDAIAEKYFSRFQPGRDWYVSYVALKGIPDIDLKDFVEECRGNTMLLPREDGSYEPGSIAARLRRQGRRMSFMISEAEIRPGEGVFLNGDNTLHLGKAVVPIKIKIPLLISPRKGRAAGKRLKIEPILTGAIAGSRLLAEVWPEEIECGDKPTITTITLTIAGNWDNEIVGALLFKPLDGSIFIVHPTQFQFRFEKPAKLSVGRYDPALDQGEYDPIDWLAVGPLKAGERCSEKMSIRLEGDIVSADIDLEAVPEIRLPEGVTCTANVYLEGLLSKRAYVEVVVEASDDVVLREGKQFTGKLYLINPSRTISLEQASVPLKVFTPKPESQASLHDWKVIGLIVGVPLAILTLLTTFGVVRFRVYRRKFIPADGWLVALESPLKGEAKNIDLEQLSVSLKQSELTIGSDPSCQIRLPHKTVSKEHALLRTGREGNPAPVYIAPSGINDVSINNVEIDKETKLQDRDIIDIGAFQFLYSNSHMKQVVVHYNDGDVKYGVPMTWNIGEDGFVLRPEGEASDAPQAYIPFRDLKAIFFVKAFDKEIARKMRTSTIATRRDPIIVKFKDGESIEGHTMQDYDAKARRFFIVPKVEPDKEENNLCILIERASTESVEVLEKKM